MRMQTLSIGALTLTFTLAVSGLACDKTGHEVAEEVDETVDTVTEGVDEAVEEVSEEVEEAVEDVEH